MSLYVFYLSMRGILAVIFTLFLCFSCWSSCCSVVILLYITAAVCCHSCLCCVNHCSRFFLIWLLVEKGFLNPWAVQSCTHVHAIQPEDSGTCGFLHCQCLVFILYINELLCKRKAIFIHVSLFKATGAPQILHQVIVALCGLD